MWLFIIARNISSDISSTYYFFVMFQISLSQCVILNHDKKIMKMPKGIMSAKMYQCIFGCCKLTLKTP